MLVPTTTWTLLRRELSQSCTTPGLGADQGLDDHAPVLQLVQVLVPSPVLRVPIVLSVSQHLAREDIFQTGDTTQCTLEETDC